MRRSQIIKELGQIMVERNRVNLQARNVPAGVCSDSNTNPTQAAWAFARAHTSVPSRRPNIDSHPKGHTTACDTVPKRHAIMPKGDVTARKARMPSILY